MGNIEKVLYYNGTEEESKKIKLALLQAGIETLILPAHPSVNFYPKTAHTPNLEILGSLAGGVAHDFNNILASIQVCAEQLAEHLNEDSLMEHTDFILKATQKGSGLVSHLLSFTKNSLVEPSVVDVNRLLSELCAILKRIIGKTVSIDTEFDSEACFIKINPVQLEQIILNLAVNARDAMPNGGSLSIRTKSITLDTAHPAAAEVRPGPYISISVTDTGSGIDSTIKDRIFEPFFTTKGSKGTGLGLATVFGIINQNNGCVSVQSESGAGARFEILLPAAVL